MPITFKDLKDVDLRTSGYFQSGEKFIEAYPDAGLVTPLGADWKLEKCFLAKTYEKFADTLHNFEVREDDVWSVTFPKSGSTWCQEMIWMLNNNVDYEGAKELLDERVFYLELCILFEEPFKIASPDDLKSPRHFKTHLPVGLLPKQLWTVKPKIIFTARNPKDVGVSWFHHFKYLQGYKGDINDFVTALMNDRIIYAPFHSSVLNFWAMRDEQNVLFLTYEEMKSNLNEVLKRTAKFLGKSYTDSQYAKLEEHLSFENMKNNKSVNNEDLIKMIHQMTGASNDHTFMRKGEVGSHKSELGPEFIRQIEDWSRGKIDEFRKLQNYNEKLNELPVCFKDNN